MLWVGAGAQATTTRHNITGCAPNLFLKGGLITGCTFVVLFVVLCCLIPLIIGFWASFGCIWLWILQPRHEGNVVHAVQFLTSANTRTLVLAPFHKFFVPYQGLFGCIWDGIFELSPIFTHFQQFPPILHHPFLPTMGTPRRQG